MSLRTKCAVLLVAFELTLALTLIYTVRYIGIYFEDAAAAFKHSSAGVTRIALVQSLARDELTGIRRYVQLPGATEEVQERGAMLNAAAREFLANYPQPLGNIQIERLRKLFNKRDTAVAEYLRQANGEFSPPAPFDETVHAELFAYLGELEFQIRKHVDTSINSTFGALDDATLILSLNMIVGAALGILGMVLVRRWVLLPIQELKRTTDELGKGKLDHRAEIRSEDEFGQLAAAVNKMSSDLARIERQMILRERAAAMGELVSYIAHNIRNPLAGIQSLAESCQRDASDHQDLQKTAREMTGVIERLQKWLRELEHTCSTLELKPESVDVHEVIDNVVTVFSPMSQRRSISLQHCNRNGPQRVNLDERHFEQALAAVVANAIEAVGDNGSVKIQADSNGDGANWALTVTDSGPGIPLGLRNKVLEPAFSTKRTGQGLGLAMARKIAQLHGGDLTFECPEQGGTVFQFKMPTQPTADMTHG